MKKGKLYSKVKSLFKKKKKKTTTPSNPMKGNYGSGRKYSDGGYIQHD